MNNNDLLKVADSLLNFFFTLRSNIFNQDDLIKNFHMPPKEFEDCMEKSPLPLSHVKVIIYLAKSKSSPISQIANKLGVSKSNMTPIIDNLISYDLVNRYTDPNDRRVLRVELTPKALKIFEHFKTSAKNTLTNKISHLSDEDLIAIDEYVSKLTEIFLKVN